MKIWTYFCDKQYAKQVVISPDKSKGEKPQSRVTVNIYT